MVQNDVDLPDDYYNYEGYYIEEREKDEWNLWFKIYKLHVFNIFFKLFNKNSNF